MKKTKTPQKPTAGGAAKPVSVNQSNGTLKGPKQGNHTDVSKGTKDKPSGLVSKGDSNAKLGKGGKSTC